MRLKKAMEMKKCDVLGCKNVADFQIDTKGIIKNHFYFCEDCLKKMFKSYIGTSVPKPIESPFRPKARIRKEER